MMLMASIEYEVKIRGPIEPRGMARIAHKALFLLLWLGAISVCDAFTISALPAKAFSPRRSARCTTPPFHQMSQAPADADSSELVAKRILVKGDIGGYYRQCVVNEVRTRANGNEFCYINVSLDSSVVYTVRHLEQAGRFRRLVGTMTPPDGSDEAEIYVEGKRKLVDGFIRWCRKGDVGLSQVVKVVDVIDEDPTGLYDAFYAKVRGDS